VNEVNWALAGVTFLLAAITGWYAFEMRRSVGRMDKEREEMHRPVLIFQLIPWYPKLVKLRIQNVGSGAASNIKGMFRTVTGRGTTGWSWSYPVLSPGKYEEFGIQIPSDAGSKACFNIDEIKSKVTEVQVEFTYKSIPGCQYKLEDSINVQKVIEDWSKSKMMATEDHPDRLLPRIAKALDELPAIARSLEKLAKTPTRKQTPEEMLEVVKLYQAHYDSKDKQRGKQV